jgi:hypothetical protein
MDSVGLYTTTYGVHVSMEGQELGFTREPKQKLTLGVNKDVIDRAKAAGINISVITEEILIALTYGRGAGSNDLDVSKAYHALFDVIERITENYAEAIFEVGVSHDNDGYYEDRPIIYGRYFGFSIGETQHELVEVINHLYEPSKILNNLVSALIRASETNKKKIRELELALRFAKILEEGGKQDNNESE